MKIARSFARSMTAILGIGIEPVPVVAAHPADPTRGGAGGRFCGSRVLRKKGPGSLAEALAAKGPRIIVFEVAGAIDLARTTLTISEPHVTVAGQTAPSPGITLLRGGIDVKTHDVILSHLRVLMGVDGQARFSGWEADAFSTVAAQRVVVENCTFLWAIDENMSASGPRFTGQRSTNGGGAQAATLSSGSIWRQKGSPTPVIPRANTQRAHWFMTMRPASFSTAISGLTTSNARRWSKAARKC